MVCPERFSIGLLYVLIYNYCVYNDMNINTIEVILMSDTATLNVRMDSNTKQDFLVFCEEIGISASSLMNMFAKTVIRNQEVPFALTTRPLDNSKYSRLFPRNESELDRMLSEAENTPSELCVPAVKAFASFEERMGW